MLNYNSDCASIDVRWENSVVFQTMQICGAGPYDQHIMLGEHELIDDNLSLAALGIFPGALLTLKVGFDLSQFALFFHLSFFVSGSSGIWQIKQRLNREKQELVMCDEAIAAEMKETKLRIFENLTEKSLLQNYLYNYKNSGTHGVRMSFSKSIERALVKFTLL